jgi:hypothetical protein
MRTVLIWVFGLVASGIAGSFVGGYLQPYSDGAFFGFCLGLAAFACARLWLAERTPKVPANADLICQAMVLAARNLGAKTPREAAEISQGRELSDPEWQQHRATWERNWAR